MFGLWYLLGFLSASAAFSVAAVIYAAKKRKSVTDGKTDDGFLSILKF